MINQQQIYIKEDPSKYSKQQPTSSYKNTQIQKIHIDGNKKQSSIIHHKKNKYLSYFLMGVSCICWVTGYLYCNDHNLDPIQTSMLRGFMIAVVSVVLCIWQGIQLNLKNNVKLLMERNCIFLLQGFVMAVLQFYIPLSILHTLGVSAPIFVNIWQYIFERKTPHLNEYVAVIVTIIGIIFAVNGNYFLKLYDPTYQFSSQFVNYRTNDPKIIAFCSLLYILFMILVSYGLYSTSTMKVSPFLINFLFGIKLYLISSLLYPFINYTTTNQSVEIRSPNVDKSIFYWGLPLSGFLFAISETTFVISIVMAENIGMTIMMSSFNIVVAYIVSLLKYHEQINIFCFGGSVLIVIGLAKIMLHS